jgi:hypothetical protein
VAIKIMTPDGMLGVLDMLENIKKWFGQAPAARPAPTVEVKQEKPKEKQIRTPSKTEKELATERGEPYVSIVRLEVDPDNLHQGAFELDWNEKFVANLIRAGYMLKKDDTDADIVDRWFQNICRHVVMETWEQEQAINNSGRFVRERDIGNGRSEVS